MAEDVEAPEAALDEGSLGEATEAFQAFLNGGNDPPQEQSQGAAAPQAPAAAQPEAPAQAAPVVEAPAPVPQPPAAQAPAPVQQAQTPAAAPAATTAPAVDRLIQIGEAAANVLAQRFLTQFPDIKTRADLSNVMRTDPGRYNEYTVAKWETEQEIGRIGAVIQEHRQADERTKQEQETIRAQAAVERSKEIAELIPDLLKPDVAPKLSADMTAYARANKVPPSRYAFASAGEVNMLYKAMQWDASKASEAAAIKTASEKASKAPPVQQPGTRVPGDGKTEKMQESFTNLQRTGRVDAAADVLRHMLG